MEGGKINNTRLSPGAYLVFVRGDKNNRLCALRVNSQRQSFHPSCVM